MTSAILLRCVNSTLEYFMGINPHDLSEHQRSLLSLDARRALYASQESKRKRKPPSPERVLHDQFSAFCRRNSIIYWHSDPRMKSTIRAGLPDFLCLRENKVVLIEFKVGTNDLTAEQEEVFCEIRQCGNEGVHVFIDTAQTNAYEEATDLLKRVYNLGEDG